MKNLIKTAGNVLCESVQPKTAEIKDFLRDYKSEGQVHIASNNGAKSVKGEKTSSKWPSGAPVTKKFKRGTCKIPTGEFEVLETNRHWYWHSDGVWYAITKKDFPFNPPFDV